MTGKLTHHMEQLGAGLSEFAAQVLAPCYRAMLDAGLPPDVALALIVALQSDFLALTLDDDPLEDDGGE